MSPLPPDARHPPARGLGWIVWGVLLMIGFLVGSSYWSERGLPRHEGKSLRAWLGAYSRAVVLRSGSGRAREARLLECQLAMLSMGTSAIPYLVDQAFRFRTSSALQSNLAELSEGLPEWAGGGSFIPGSRRAEIAAELLRELRPPGDVLYPLLRARFADTNAYPHRQAVFLAPAMADVPPEAAAWLSGILTNASEEEWTRSLAVQSVVWAGASTSNALPAVVAYLRSRTNGIDARIAMWFGMLGSRSADAVPLLERYLDATNSWIRSRVAVALPQIVPGHPRALALIRSALETSSRSQGEVLSSLHYPGTLPIPELVEPLVALARAQVESWTPNFLTFEACWAVERHAPDRARELYRELFERRPNSAVAGRWLRLDRTNARVARLLMDRAGANVIEPWSAVSWLSEADASNPGVIPFLEKVAASGKPPLADDARYALARIRWRAAQAARGVSILSDR